MSKTNLEYAMAPKMFDANLSGNITKVKFYHEYSAEDQCTNTSYTIKIYNNINLTPLVAGYSYYTEESCGTAVFTQDYTATEDGWQEVTLTTPCAIPAGDFWVSIKPNNGYCALPLGGSASAIEGQGYMQYDFSSYGMGNAWVTSELGQGTTTLYTIALAIYVDDGGAEEIASDMEARLFGGFSGGYLVGSPDAYTIGTAEDLVIYPFFANNGPSTATSGTVTCMVKVGGETVDTQTIELSEEESMGVGEGWNSPYETGSYTITAAVMDAINGLGNTFDVCFEISYTGNDNVAANNSYCIPVTRTNASSDLEALLFADAQCTTPIASTITLESTENFLVYMAIRNNGPDAAAGTVAVTLSLDGAPQTQNLSLAEDPLPNGEILNLDQDGLEFSAEEMDMYIAASSFEICFSIAYATDPNTANNEVCVTVTRQTTSVEENIAASVSVYPNPANDIFTVANAEGANIVVVNSLGQVVANIENAAANQTIDASNFANGTYFVKVNEEVVKINVVK